MTRAGTAALGRGILCVALTAAALCLAPLHGATPARAGDDLSSPAALRAAYGGPATSWPGPDIDAGVAFVELAALPSPPADPGRQKAAALGARLFFDPALSASGAVACATCHDPAHGYSVATAVARGHDGRPGRRNPPSLLELSARAKAGFPLGWDGRQTTLAAQVLAPLLDPDEMANRDLGALLARLAADGDTASAFASAYGTGTPAPEQLADALAAYLEGLDGITRFDRFAAGDQAALSDEERLGLHLFRTKARCANCHFGPHLSDGRFHNLRISSFGEPAQDLGRYRVTEDPTDAGAFRTPSLRHVGATAPYMHSGLFTTLEGVIAFYDRGGGEVWARNGREAARPLYPEAARLSPHIRPLGLTPQEKAALAAFLRAL